MLFYQFLNFCKNIITLEKFLLVKKYFIIFEIKLKKIIKFN